MPRLIIHDRNRPFEIKPTNRSKWICQCGLSENAPFCDGSHTIVDSESLHEYYHYSSKIKSQRLITRINNYLDTCIEMRPAALLFKHPTDNYEIKRVEFNSETHQLIQLYRKVVNPNYVDDGIDFWSDIYALFVNNEFAASLRCTQARNGKIDMQEYYPSLLFTDNLKSLICSNSKFFKLIDKTLNPSLLRNFTIIVCRDQYVNGMRIDIINSTYKMVPYYKRLGYQVIGEEFIHPSTHQRSRVMYLYVHRTSTSPFITALSDILVEEEQLVTDLTEFL